MKKIKKENILLFIFIFVAIFSIIIKKPINNLDELWNYNTARAITQGLLPYKDISMITTPLLPTVTALFLKIFTNEVMVSRILAGLICSGILYTIYKVFSILLKEKNISLIFTALIGILFRDIYCIDYNLLILLISLMILYNEIKNIKDKKDMLIVNKKNDFIIRHISWISNMYKAKYRNNFIIYSNNI